MRADKFPDRSIERLGGHLVMLYQVVPIDIERRLHSGVPEARLDRLGGESTPDHHRGVSVPQIMEAEALDARLRQEAEPNAVAPVVRAPELAPVTSSVLRLGSRPKIA